MIVIIMSLLLELVMFDVNCVKKCNNESNSVKVVQYHKVKESESALIENANKYYYNNFNSEDEKSQEYKIRIYLDSFV